MTHLSLNKVSEGRASQIHCLLSASITANTFFIPKGLLLLALNL